MLMVSTLSHCGPSSIQVSWKSVEEFLCNPADKPCDKQGHRWKQRKEAIMSTWSSLHQNMFFSFFVSQATQTFWKISIKSVKIRVAQLKLKIRQNADRTCLVNTSVWIVFDGSEHIHTGFFLYKCQQQYQSSDRLRSTFHCFAAVSIQITVHYFSSTYFKWAY